MSTGDDEKSSGAMAGAGAGAGPAEPRAFVAAEIPAEPLRPTVEMDRVQVIDPRHSPTLPPREQRKMSGPRAPEQRTLVAEEERASVPMERPATKMQVIKIDPEVLLELSRKKAARAGGATAVPTSPWAAAAAAVEIEIEIEIDKSALPSALGPRVQSVPVPAVVTPVRAVVVGEEKRSRRGLAIGVGAVLVVGAAFAVVRGMSSATGGGVVAVEPGAAAVTSAAPVVSVAVAPVVVPVPSAEVDAGAPVVPGAEDGGVPLAVKTRDSGVRKIEDPYETAMPAPGKTAESVVAPPTIPVVPSATAAPPKPSATAPGPAPDDEIFSRPKKKPEEGVKP